MSPARPNLRSIVGVLAAWLAASSAVVAYQLDVPGPAGTQAFGTAVLVLPNGNLVVTDPEYLSGVGAVYLLTPDGTQISRLTGSAEGDRVGSGGVVQVGSTHFVVQSPQWQNASLPNAGAVTWVHGNTGLSGAVDATNSLVGDDPGDAVGIVEALGNGNYVVCSPGWNSEVSPDAGAVTFGPGNSGVRGVVSPANSLVGAQLNDRIGSECVEQLSNGNYVVMSPDAKNGFVNEAGAATLGDGATGSVGFVSSSNSLVGTHEGDHVGGGVTALSNGNYVVTNSEWDNGTTPNAGAATFGNGTTGVVGAVSVANSLVGTQAEDRVGVAVTALANGHYVVTSPAWANGAAEAAGAATWGSGTNGISGPVTVLNSLVGSQADDAIGSNGVIALTNGNYVVASPFWRSGLVPNVGAATWGNGSSGTVGAVSTGNSLTGSNFNDLVGSTVVALTNGNYVVASPFWRNGGAANAGAVTLGGGSGFAVGPVTSGNSLVGTQAADSVGLEITPLSNGNFVVHSPFWDNGATTDVGAITWCNGSFNTTGAVTVFNSLRGLFIGSLASCRFAPWLVDNYQYSCRNLLGDDAGGVAGVSGTVSTGSLALPNSLTGAVGDRIGDGGLEILSNTRYVAYSPAWSGGRGAVSLVALPVLVTETVNAGNSVLGPAPGGGASMVYDYSPARDELVVGQPAVNRISILDRVSIFRNGFE